MTAFFRMHRKQKIIFSKFKSRNKIPGHVFLDFILLFHNAVENSQKKKQKKPQNKTKKKFSRVGAIKRDFSKPRTSRFWVQILEIW